MIIEVPRFVEAKNSWWQSKTSENLEWEPITIDVRYIAWAKRFRFGPLEFCEVGMTDWHQMWVLDISYEQMNAVMVQSRTKQ